MNLFKLINSNFYQLLPYFIITTINFVILLITKWKNKNILAIIKYTIWEINPTTKNNLIYDSYNLLFSIFIFYNLIFPIFNLHSPLYNVNYIIILMIIHIFMQFFHSLSNNGFKKTLVNISNTKNKINFINLMIAAINFSINWFLKPISIAFRIYINILVSNKMHDAFSCFKYGGIIIDFINLFKIFILLIQIYIIGMLTKMIYDYFDHGH